MKWRWKQLGQHVHVNVYLNGAHCGHLIFRAVEFSVMCGDGTLDRVTLEEDFS